MVTADVYAAHRGALVRLASLLTGSHEAAEDIVQDVFVRTAGRLADLEDPTSYLRAAVVNGARSMHRRDAVVRRHPPEPRAAEQPRTLIELRDVLLSLPERQRAVLVLRYFADVSDDEIASVLGCRRSTVRSLARRGLSALREALP